MSNNTPASRSWQQADVPLYRLNVA